MHQCVLGLGHKFIPPWSASKHIMINSIRHSLINYERSLLLALYFGNQPYNPSPIPRLPSVWSPPEADYTPLVRSYINSIYKHCQSINVYLKQHDITTFVNQSLSSLIQSSPTPIHIGIADKNVGIFIDTQSNYDTMVYNILNDIKTYNKLDENSKLVFNQNNFNLLRALLEHHKKLYSGKRAPDGTLQVSQLAKSLLQLENSPLLRPACLFYILYKEHKSPVVGRPIANNINTCTYYASIYLDRIFSPLIKRLPGICFNSSEVLRAIASIKVNADAVLFCADIKSLYPSIPTAFGLKAVRHILRDHFYMYLSNEDIDFYLDLLQWILNHNYISYKGDIYHQISGCAMGTPVAVSYSIMVVFYMERNITNTFTLYFRYIDDVFAISSSHQIVQTFLASFAQICPEIQFDAITIGKVGIFLDLLLSITTNGNVISNLYQKPVNTYNYIPPTSSHATRIFSNIIVNELKRYRLNCSLTTDYFNIKLLYYDRLIKRGFNPKFLYPLFNTMIDRDKLLVPNNSSNITIKPIRRPRVVFSLPSNLITTPDSAIRNVPMDLLSHKAFKNAYDSPHPMIVRKNPPSLRLFFTKLTQSSSPAGSTQSGKLSYV